jgi:hypothetical protein
MQDDVRIIAKRHRDAVAEKSHMPLSDAGLLLQAHPVVWMRTP